MAVDEALFRQALGHFASGVTVVTTTHAGQHFGLTLSSFTSLSLRPALVLICVDTGVASHKAISAAGGFVVNVLDQHQEHLSRKFAASDEEKYTGVAWHVGQLGFPVLEDVLAVIECQLYQALPGGDHTIFVGEVVAVTIGKGGPLLYYRRGYHELK